MLRSFCNVQLTDNCTMKMEKTFHETIEENREIESYVS